MTQSKAAERLILRGGLATALGFLARFGARILFLFVAGQLYGATLFGAFSLAVAIVELAATVGGLGTRKLLFQLLDRNEERGARPAGHIVVDAALLVTTASLALAGMIVAVTALLPAAAVGENTRTALLIVAPLIAAQALLDLLTASTRWKHLMRYEVLSRSVVEPYAGIAAAAAAYYAGLQATGLAISYWTGTLAALLFSMAGARRAFAGFQLRAYRTSLPLLAATLGSTVANTASDFLNGFFTRLDLYLVGMLMGEAPAGIYGMARQLRTPVRQVRQSLDSLLTPIATRTLDAQGPAHTALALASASRLIFAVQLPVLLALVAVGPMLLDAFGSGFSIGYHAMLIVTAAEVIQGAFGLSGLVFVYRDPWLGLRITALWILVGIAAGLALIPAWGIEGAAGAVLIAYAGMAVHRRLALARRFQVKVPARHSLGPVVAALFGLAATLLAGEVLEGAPGLVAAVFAALAGLAVYSAALFAWMSATGERLSMAGFVTGPEGSAGQSG